MVECTYCNKFFRRNQARCDCGRRTRPFAKPPLKDTEIPQGPPLGHLDMDTPRPVEPRRPLGHRFWLGGQNGKRRRGKSKAGI